MWYSVIKEQKSTLRIPQVHLLHDQCLGIGYVKVRGEGPSSTIFFFFSFSFLTTTHKTSCNAFRCISLQKDGAFFVLALDMCNSFWSKYKFERIFWLFGDADVSKSQSFVYSFYNEFHIFRTIQILKLIIEWPPACRVGGGGHPMMSSGNSAPSLFRKCQAEGGSLLFLSQPAGIVIEDGSTPGGTLSFIN